MQRQQQRQHLSEQDDGPHDHVSHAQLCADEDRWSTLAIVGIQECYGLRGDDVIELRNCTCGSTLGRRTRRTQ